LFTGVRKSAFDTWKLEAAAEEMMEINLMTILDLVAVWVKEMLTHQLTKMMMEMNQCLSPTPFPVQED
jgi:hypothetical protein